MPVINSSLGRNVKIFYPNLTNIYDSSIDANTTIGPFVEIQKNVKIGKNCKISSHSFICEGVTIGDNCFIGHGVMFINDRYPEAVDKKGQLKKNNNFQLEKTLIGNNVSIGTNSTIMCGIEIKDFCIIGAASLVLSNTKKNSVYVGSPAKFLKKSN